jgi:hypothetical protein
MREVALWESLVPERRCHSNTGSKATEKAGHDMAAETGEARSPRAVSVSVWDFCAKSMQ